MLSQCSLDIHCRFGQRAQMCQAAVVLEAAELVHMDWPSKRDLLARTVVMLATGPKALRRVRAALTVRPSHSDQREQSLLPAEGLVRRLP